MAEQPKRGGARPGAGRKAEDGAAGLVALTVKVPPDVKAWAGEVGAAAIRQLLITEMQKTPHR
jgi:hypothetical protein